MIRGKNGDWALVKRSELRNLLDDLACAANYCPDYFLEGVSEVIERAEKLVKELA